MDLLANSNGRQSANDHFAGHREFTRDVNQFANTDFCLVFRERSNRLWPIYS